MRSRTLLLVCCGLALLAAGYAAATHYGWLWAEPAVAQDRGSAQGGAKPAGQAEGHHAQKTSVVTAVATRKALPRTLYTVGFGEAIASVDVKPQITGAVMQVTVKDGQMVKAGDLLLKLDDRTLRANIAKDQATIAKSEANLAQANGDAERARTLLQRNAGSQQLADQAIAAAKAAAATVEADRAVLQADQIQLGYTNITAPISGRVGVVNTSVGNYVTAGTSLMIITQMAPMRVSFALPERNLDTLRELLAAPVADNVAIRTRDEKEPRTHGTLNFVDSSVDRDTGTVVAKADVANADGALWPGQYVQIAVSVGDQPENPTVPLQALQQGPDGTFVFRVKADQTVERVKVEVADVVGQNAAVTAGIEAGDHVVIEGQLRLADGAAIRETLRDEPRPADQRSLSAAESDRNEVVR
jgi:multidrug efflux system membrane fusion protein